jgi:hypothetical protein
VLHFRGRVRVLRVQVRDDFGVRLFPQPEVVVGQYVAMERVHSRDGLCYGCGGGLGGERRGRRDEDAS